MIYRALECTLYDSRGPHATVWFEAPTDEEASAKLTALLSLAWGVDAATLCIGNVFSQKALLLKSVQDLTVGGDRVWFETGSHGDWPTYYVGDDEQELVFLRPHLASRLKKAKEAARAHAAELAALCEDEIAAVQAGSRQSQMVKSWRFDQANYRRFADHA